MDKALLRRRQLLLYLGLGITAAGGAVAVGVNAHRSSPVSPTSNAPVGNPQPQTGSVSHRALPPAGDMLPEFQGIDQWLNSKPLSIADLKGKVVLVQFWTFACINCQRTLPYIVQWHQRYATQGLQVIGVHTPEFAYEREIGNIKRALQQHQITYPVPVDNGYKTWNAYKNEYWPRLFLADRQGLLRYDHIGEGAYDQTEQTIRQLLSGGG